MTNQSYSDAEIISGIQSGGTQRDRALGFVYRNKSLRSRLITYVKGNRGNLQDAEDIWAEALIVFDRNVRNNAFRGDSRVEDYVYGIGRFLWWNRYRKQGRQDLVAEVTPLDNVLADTPYSLLLEDESRELLHQILGKLGDRCQQVLMLWASHYKMEEIKNIVGFSSAEMAKKEKYKCFQKLLEWIADHPHLLENLK